MKKLLMILLACSVLLLAACGSAQSAVQPAEEPAAAVEEPAEDGQNPVMNFVGLYTCERASILVEAVSADTAKFTVNWGSSYNESAVWTMSGVFDTEELNVYYQDCVRSNVTYQDNGEVADSEEVYVNGHGFFFFDAENNTLTWQDDQEHVADGMTFVMGGGVDPDGPVYGEGDPDYYSAFSAMDKAAIEEIADFIRTAYLNEDWAALTELIRYPITINGTELADAEAFLSYMSDKTVHESDRAAMEEETCHDMFYNGQGLCLGSGSIWLLDPNYMTDEDPRIQIITISGIVGK